MLKGNSKGVMGENIREGKKAGLSERDAVMVSMKNSKKEKKATSGGAMQSSSYKGEDYPYSSRLDLDHEMMDKLGIDKMPAHGTAVQVHAKAKVHSTSEDTGSDGKKRRRMTLQMTHMKVG